MDLFDHALKQRLATEAPLAARMRPRTLDEFGGQEDIVGAGRLVRRAIEADRLFASIILWGPPGTGKTTLAMIIANSTQSHFETMSAVLAGKPELRKVIDEAIDHLVHVAGGDARNALNALELAVETTPSEGDRTIHVSLDVAQESIQRRAVLYDKDGDAHYDTISAFIKSVRGSDPDAALYWLAKMLYAGESPRFIIRR